MLEASSVLLALRTGLHLPVLEPLFDFGRSNTVVAPGVPDVKEWTGEEEQMRAIISLAPSSLIAYKPIDGSRQILSLNPY